MGTDDSIFEQLGQRDLVNRMHAQLDELLVARDQMEQLLRLLIKIGSDPRLDATLQHIVAAARQLTGARYGALGVRARDGSLALFVHDGMDTETIRRIGHLPAGKGLLGLLLKRTDTLRTRDLTRHEAAVGFPEYHPPMRAFLGVPIIIRDETFGSVYLADDRPGWSFTEAHENVVRALASAAAVAIENAQLFERITMSARWVEAGREITTALLAGVDRHTSPLQLIAERARELADAVQVIVLVPTDAEAPPEEVDTLVVAATAGGQGEVIGQQVPVEGSTTGGVFRSGRLELTTSFAQPIPAFTDAGERSAIVMPLRSEDCTLGVIAVARESTQPPFGSDLLEVVSDFANHAAIALKFATAREQARELSVLADRERIARDLHDHVIQRLFVAGMDLQGTLARAHSPELRKRLAASIDDLQATIDDIRMSIFQLQSTVARPPSLSERLQDLVAKMTRERGITTTFRIVGPLASVDDALGGHAEAVVGEAVSNAVRHSGASRLAIEVSVGDELEISVADNGRGIPADNQRRSGLGNFEDRARLAGGSCEITAPPEGGTRVVWRAPLIGY